MRFSLVTCTRGRSREVAELFESLCRQKRGDFEVILVDQNADDRLFEIVAQYSGLFPLKHIRMQEIGVSRGRNAGIDHASGEIIGFPDDDCQYLDGYLEAVDNVFAYNPTIGCITGNITDVSDRKLDSACLKTKMDLTSVSLLNRCQEFTVFVRRQSLGSIRYNVDLGVGADTLWGAEEGPDLLIRVVNSGTRLVFFPGMYVYHPVKTADINRATLQRAISYARGRGCLLRLHSFPFATILNSVFRPAAGGMFYLLRLKPTRSLYYFTIFVGTARGLLITGKELAKVREASYAPVPEAVPVQLYPLSPQPLVTVVIANYNYARFLPAALNSVLAQTYENWQIVICDDGSTDDSLSIIRQYMERDRRIELVEKVNGGQNSAFNAGYRGARGEVVCLLDADDVFESTKVEEVVNHFRKNPRTGLCNHFSQVIDEGGDPKPVEMHRTLDSGWQGNQALMRGGCVYVPTTSCVSIRREIANLIFPVPQRQDRDLDGYLAMVAQFLTPIGVLPQKLSGYRIHGKNMGGLTDPTSQRLQYELHLIQLRTSNMKDFLGRRFGDAFASRVTIEDNPQYIQAALKLMAIERRADSSTRPSGLIRRHPNGKWRMFWRVLFAVPSPVTRMAVPYLHRSHRIKTFVHLLLSGNRITSPEKLAES